MPLSLWRVDGRCCSRTRSPEIASPRRECSRGHPLRPPNRTSPSTLPSKHLGIWKQLAANPAPRPVPAEHSAPLAPHPPPSHSTAYLQSIAVPPMNLAAPTASNHYLKVTMRSWDLANLATKLAAPLPTPMASSPGSGCKTIATTQSQYAMTYQLY